MTARSQSLVPWEARPVTLLPNDADPPRLLALATGLRSTDSDRVNKLFDSESYDIAAEFVWRRSMAKLRETLAQLGMRFIGEMLSRDDINEHSSPDRVLTEYDTLRLAEQLGFVTPTGAFRLQQSFEALAHFTSERADDALSRLEAVNILRNCVQYLLRDTQAGSAFDFANLRARLLSETLTADDPQLTLLLDSPPFFLGTTVRILLSGAKSEKGARVEHAIRNLSNILPTMWPRLPEQEKWNVGLAYAEVSAAGKSPAVSGLRLVLHRVSGFDYVPENLRSNSYKRAAQAVIDAHFGADNFYHEAEPVERLAKMGTSIPKPALAECIQAFLCVYIGNHYGNSWAAEPTAFAELKNLSEDRWQYYLERILPTDSIILSELQSPRPATRLSFLVRALSLQQIIRTQARANDLVVAAFNNQTSLIISEAEHFWKTLKLGPSGSNV